MAIPAQLRIVEKLLEPKSMEIPDSGYMGPKLAEDPRYGRSCGTSQLAITLAVYDRSEPGAARAMIVARSDFERTSPKLFWSEILAYLLPGAELNQILTLVVAIKLETPCEPELLLLAGMNDHLHEAGLLEHLTGGEPTPKKIWEAIQTMFAAMNEVQKLVPSRFGSDVQVIARLREHATSITVLVCNFDPDSRGQAWRMLMTAPNCELEPVNLRLLSLNWQRHGRMYLIF